MSIIERAASRLKTTAAQRPAGSSELLSAAELAAQQQPAQVQVQAHQQVQQPAHQQQEPLPSQPQHPLQAAPATTATAAQPAPVALASSIDRKSVV